MRRRANDLRYRGPGVRAEARRCRVLTRSRWSRRPQRRADAAPRPRKLWHFPAGTSPRRTSARRPPVTLGPSNRSLDGCLHILWNGVVDLALANRGKVQDGGTRRVVAQVIRQVTVRFTDVIDEPVLEHELDGEPDFLARPFLLGLRGDTGDLAAQAIVEFPVEAGWQRRSLVAQ